MILITTGRGAWIFGAPMLTLTAAVILQHLLLPAAHRAWPISLALAAAAMICLRFAAQARTSAKVLVLERHTGRERMQRPIDSAYGIPAEYWGLLYLGLAGWVLTLRLTQ